MTTNETMIQQMIIKSPTILAALRRVANDAERIEMIVQLGEQYGLPVTPGAVREYFDEIGRAHV